MAGSGGSGFIDTKTKPNWRWSGFLQWFTIVIVRYFSELQKNILELWNNDNTVKKLVYWIRVLLSLDPQPSAPGPRAHLLFYGLRPKLLFRGPHISRLLFHGPELSKLLFHGPVGRKYFLYFCLSKFQTFQLRKLKCVMNHMIKYDIF